MRVSLRLIGCGVVLAVLICLGFPIHVRQRIVKKAPFLPEAGPGETVFAGRYYLTKGGWECDREKCCVRIPPEHALEVVKVLKGRLPASRVFSKQAPKGFSGGLIEGRTYVLRLVPEEHTRAQLRENEQRGPQEKDGLGSIEVFARELRNALPQDE